MPTVKSVTPKGTARERLDAKKQKAETGLKPQDEALLERCRAAAAMHKETGKPVVDLATIPVQQPVDLVELDDEEQPIPEIEPIVSDEDMMIEVEKPFAFRIAGNRTVVMAPPTIPTQLTIVKMFNHIKEIDLETQGKMQCAKILQYVRSINGMPRAGFMTTWEEASALLHELGELGYRAVRDVYESRWPDSGETLWIAAKKK